VSDREGEREGERGINKLNIMGSAKNQFFKSCILNLGAKNRNKDALFKL
jgi:hypothetical protein